ncbi:MAG: cytochrome c [Dehalococcoidia bacterium]
MLGTVIVLSLVVFLLAGCKAAPAPASALVPAPAPATAPAPAPAPDPALADHPSEDGATAPAHTTELLSSAAAGTPEGGSQLYAGFCAACHGVEAQGTAFAPSLPGHLEEVVKRQVRTPLGKMPAFSTDAISDHELDAIAGFIAALPVSDHHAEPVDMEGGLVMHHWMLVYAIQGGDVQDAVHHMSHVLEIDMGQEHKHRMEEVNDLLKQGELHGAEHEIEEMLAEYGEPQVATPKLHLQMALFTAEEEDIQETLHHMGHFTEGAQGTGAEMGREVIGLLMENNLHEAEHEIGELLEAPLTEGEPETHSSPTLLSDEESAHAPH